MFKKLKRTIFALMMVSLLSVWPLQSIEAVAVPPAAILSVQQAVIQVGGSGQLNLQLHQLATNQQIQIRYPKGVKFQLQQIQQVNLSQLKQVQQQNDHQLQLSFNANTDSQLQIPFQVTAPPDGPVQIWAGTSMLATTNLNVVPQSSVSSKPVADSSQATIKNQANVNSSTANVASSQPADASTQDSNLHSAQPATTPVSKATSATTSNSTSSTKTQSTSNSLPNSSTASSQSISNDSSSVTNSSKTTSATVSSSIISTPLLDSQAKVSVSSEDGLQSPLSTPGFPNASTQQSISQTISNQNVAIIGQLPLIDFGSIGSIQQAKMNRPFLKSGTTADWGIVDASPQKQHWQLRLQAQGNSSVFDKWLFWQQGQQLQALSSAVTIVDSEKVISQPIVQNGRTVARYYPLLLDHYFQTNLRLILPSQHLPKSGRYLTTLTWTIQQVPSN